MLLKQLMFFFRMIFSYICFIDLNSYFEKSSHQGGTESLFPKRKLLSLLTCSWRKSSQRKRNTMSYMAYFYSAFKNFFLEINVYTLQNYDLHVAFSIWVRQSMQPALPSITLQLSSVAMTMHSLIFKLKLDLFQRLLKEIDFRL